MKSFCLSKKKSKNFYFFQNEVACKSLLQIFLGLGHLKKILLVSDSK